MAPSRSCAAIMVAVVLVAFVTALLTFAFARL